MEQFENICRLIQIIGNLLWQKFSTSIIFQILLPAFQTLSLGCCSVGWAGRVPGYVLLWIHRTSGWEIFVTFPCFVTIRRYKLINCTLYAGEIRGGGCLSLHQLLDEHASIMSRPSSVTQRLSTWICGMEAGRQFCDIDFILYISWSSYWVSLK